MWSYESGTRLWQWNPFPWISLMGWVSPQPPRHEWGDHTARASAVVYPRVLRLIIIFVVFSTG
jgi:hypothetical protein